MCVVELTPSALRADLRVGDVSDRLARIETMAPFVVEDGRAGAQRA